MITLIRYKHPFSGPMVFFFSLVAPITNLKKYFFWKHCPISVPFLFQHEERAFVLKFSAIEIYNEVLRDLLSAENTPLRLWDDAEVKNKVPKHCKL